MSHIYEALCLASGEVPDHGQTRQTEPNLFVSPWGDRQEEGRRMVSHSLRPPAAPPDGRQGHLRAELAAVSPVACSRFVLSDNAVRTANRVCQLLAEREQVVVFMGLDEHDQSSRVCVDVAVATGIIEETRVLLIDANTASPQVHKLLGIRSVPGLCDVIQGKATLEDAIRTTDVPNLDVLPVGTPPELAASLFASARFNQSLQTLRGRYRCIFADGGTRKAPETMVLGAVADAMVIALGAGRWRRTDLQNLKREITVLNARLLGVVLTEPKG